MLRDPDQGGWRAPMALAGFVLMVGVAGAAVAVMPPRGAVLLVLSATRGLHAGDLLALVPLAAAAWVTPQAGRPIVNRIRRVHGLAMVPVGVALVVLGALDAVGVLTGVAATAVVLGGGLGSWAVADRQAARSSVSAGAAVACLVALVAGWLVDAALFPSGTVVGPMLLATTVGATRWPGSGARRWATFAALLALVNVGALVDPLGFDALLARRGGGDARTVALGAAIALGGMADRVRNERGSLP